MIKTREELMTMITARVGEDTSDEAISFMEDITDTLNDYETKLAGDGTDWKTKYEENDRQWREKYIARFNGTGEDLNQPNRNQFSENENKKYSYEDLFKEG